MVRLIRRYNSTIYGNYRKSYLIDGAITGAVMAVIMLVRDLFAGSALASPENLLTDVVLLIGIFWWSYQYRSQLPEQKVSLKELMLLGLGIGLVSAVVYGLWIWLYCGSINTDMVEYYNQCRIKMMEPAETSADAKLAVELVKKYTAGDWGFISGFRLMVWSIFISFFSSLLFRTEKSPVRVKNK